MKKRITGEITKGANRARSTQEQIKDIIRRTGSESERITEVIELNSELTGELTALRGEVTTTAQEVTTLGTQVTTNTETLSKLQTTVTNNYNALGTKINSVQTNTNRQITTANSKITALQNQVSDLSANTPTTSMLDELQTQIDDSFTRINTLTTRTNDLQSGLDEHTNAIAENGAAISTLSVDQQNTAYEVGENKRAITALEGRLDDYIANNSGENGLSGAVSVNAAAIESNTNRITALETASTAQGERISAVEQDYYGTTVAEISALEAELLNTEQIFNNGGKEKIVVNHKGSTGPKCKLFTRINPKFNPRYIGRIYLYMSNIPEGKTTATLNISINDGAPETKTIEFVSGEEYNAVIEFDFYTSKISNTFDMSFADAELAETILDYIEIESQNTNFMLLNRDYRWDFKNVNFLDGRTLSIYVDRHDMANQKQKIQFSTVFYIATIWEEHTRSDNEINIISVNPSITKNIGETGGRITTASCKGIAASNTDNYYMEVIYPNNGFTARDMNFIDIFDISTGVNSGDSSAKNVAILLKTGQLLIHLTSSDSYTNLPTLNNEYFNNEFAQCHCIFNCYILQQLYNNEIGYILVHQTGEIIFIDGKHATYFIKIGVGTQPYAYLQENQSEINIYYKTCNIIVQKKLIFNNVAQKWELDNFVKLYPQFQVVFEYGTDLRIGILDNTWKYVRI